MKEPKTRPVQGRADFFCTKHGCPVQHKVRRKTNQHTGRDEYAGEYYACPFYASCGFYVSPGDETRPPMVSVI